MKKFYTNKVLLLILVSGILAISCEHSTDPLPISTASFKVTTIAPEIDLAVQFENLSLNAAAYSWDYGDGSKDSLVTDPSHIYTSPGSYTVKMTSKSSQVAKSRTLMVLATLEAVTAPWSVQPNISVEEETTHADGGKGLTVCLCKRPHEAEHVTGQLSHNALATAHAYNGTWPPPLEKTRCAFASPRGLLL